MLFIVLQFTVTDTGLCVKFNQHFHKQMSYSYYLNTVTVVNVVASGYFLHLLLLQHGDIESNPGPMNEQTNENFSCCHANVSSLLAHSLAKISKLKLIHDFNSLITTLSAYQKHTLIHQS